MDPVSGKTAVAGNKRNQKQAESEAVASCTKKGGSNCKVTVSYGNQCGVLAWGNNWTVSRSAPTLEEASKQALDQCQRDIGAACEVFFSDCSLPVRVQ